MSKTALLESTAVDVVKSEKLPAARRQRQYGDFDAFVTNADKLAAFFKRAWDDVYERLDIAFGWLDWPPHRWFDLDEAKRTIERAKLNVASAKYTLADFPKALKRLAECQRDAKWYNRKELYDIKGKGKRQEWTLSRRVVSEQIGLLLASFQNSRPGTPKVFGKMVVEEVYAANPNACVLESACRAVRRNQNFPPSIAELLKAIEAESNAWVRRWEALDDHECDNDALGRDLQNAIAEAESTIAKAQAKLAEREAKQKADEERRAAYCAKQEQERKEAQERARSEREAKAVEEARRNEEWDRKQAAARALRREHPEIWEAAFSGLKQKMAAQDQATLAAMREAGGLVSYVAELVRARLTNGAMPKL